MMTKTDDEDTDVRLKGWAILLLDLFCVSVALLLMLYVLDTVK